MYNYDYTIKSFKVRLETGKESKEKINFIVKIIYGDEKEFHSPGIEIFKEDLNSKSHFLELLISELIKLKYLLRSYGFPPDEIKKLDFELGKTINLLKSIISSS
jgi:hypothetical protein